MIVFDTETTGLLVPEAAPLDQQPRVIELTAIKLHAGTLEAIDSLTLLINPKMLISADITGITGITNALLADKLPFAAHYRRLCDFFGGQKSIVAHNLSFDLGVMYHELRRIGKVTAFPWPPVQYCSVEETRHIKGVRLKLGDLYEILFQERFAEAHRSAADTEALAKIVRELRRKGMFTKWK